ncbi:MAG TPA: peptidylprolyl isomerase, partial [Spirochaetota bacterium]|nr:peptidylprolyl isomerase [Spirochaetota bacterium]
MKFINYFLLFFLFFSCTTNSSKIILARYDKGVVNLQEAIDEYKNLSEQDKQKYKSDEDYFKLVRKVALEKIMIDKAIQDGLLKEDEFIKKFEETKKNIAYNILKKKHVLDKITITETDYEKYKKSYELYQIVKRTDILDENKIKQSKKILENLKNEIKNIDQFKDAAKKYSEDITAGDGGFVGNLRLGIMEDEIDKVMEKIQVGKVSNVIETNVGLHLIFVNKIDKVEFNDLLQDKKLYESIYNRKVEAIENQWYDNLLKSSSLKIDKDKLKEKKYDAEIIVSYKDKKITRDEINKTVDNLRQGTFPEPTSEELLNLVKNMGLKLILEDMMESGEVINSSEYKERIEKEKIYLLKNDYIAKNMINHQITDSDIKKFYDENKTTLFTFKDDKNRDFIQPVKDVEKFIIQKL